MSFAAEEGNNADIEVTQLQAFLLDVELGSHFISFAKKLLKTVGKRSSPSPSMSLLTALPRSSLSVAIRSLLKLCDNSFLCDFMAFFL